MNAPTPESAPISEDDLTEMRILATRAVANGRADFAAYSHRQVHSLLALISDLRSRQPGAEGLAGLGCDAAAGGAHSIIREGSYSFCSACGETVRAPKLSERARAAEARATTAETRLAAAEGRSGEIWDELLDLKAVHEATMPRLTSAEARVAELEGAVAEEREACALICDAPDRTGREWVPGSLWDSISKDLGRRIRARAHSEGGSNG